MEDILRALSDYARFRVEEKQKHTPFTMIRKEAEVLPVLPEEKFLHALQKEEMSFICEVKKASPSKGVIAEDFPYVSIAKEYEAAGADAISVLTEPKWFLGSEEYLREIANQVQTPILRKDFTVDPYMIFEAKAIGASAILLICAILSAEELKEYLIIAKELGLSSLVEAHDEREIEMALKADAQIIGVNNRNLKDFSVDTSNAGNLRKYVPKEIVFVSESGIFSKEDVLAAKQSGADAVLIGEAFMRAKDKNAFLKELRSGV